MSTIDSSGDFSLNLKKNTVCLLRVSTEKYWLFSVFAIYFNCSETVYCNALFEHSLRYPNLPTTLPRVPHEGISWTTEFIWVHTYAGVLISTSVSKQRRTRSSFGDSDDQQSTTSEKSHVETIDHQTRSIASKQRGLVKETGPKHWKICLRRHGYMTKSTLVTARLGSSQ